LVVFSALRLTDTINHLISISWNEKRYKSTRLVQYLDIGWSCMFEKKKMVGDQGILVSILAKIPYNHLCST